MFKFSDIPKYATGSTFVLSRLPNEHFQANLINDTQILIYQAAIKDNKHIATYFHADLSRFLIRNQNVNNESKEIAAIIEHKVKIVKIIPHLRMKYCFLRY
jgi:phosphoribosylformylglycinamidine (FGAM) synthase-like amidotransferase family enzyme